MKLDMTKDIISSDVAALVGDLLMIQIHKMALQVDQVGLKYMQIDKQENNLP